jgi:hypothetical protein
MAVNDIIPLDDTQFGTTGSVKHQVNYDATYSPLFRPGEPVLKVLGNEYVTTLAGVTTGTTTIPQVGTNYLAGISISGQGGALTSGAGTTQKGGTVSTDTTTTAGYVYVTPLDANIIYLGNADVPATYGYNTTTGVITQATYDALVGHRVAIKMSTGNPPVYTILAADGANNACVVENLDITKYPGKVAFSLRSGLDYKA